MMNLDNKSPVPQPIIYHAQTTSIIHEYERCLRMSSAKGVEPNCMALEGQTGTGKTRLAQELVRQKPPYVGPEGVVWPIFYMQVPAETTTLRFAVAFLDALGDPTPERGDPRIRVIKMIRSVVQSVVILDDFQHLLNIDTKHRRDQVSDQLKNLIKETGKVFVVIGIEGTVEDVLRHNEQLSRLFSARMKIRPFSVPAKDNDQELYDFYQFVLKGAALSQIELATGLETFELLRRIHYATNGVAANILNLFRYAQDVAEYEHSTNQVTLGMLAQAFEYRMKAHVRDLSSGYSGKSVNPFLVSPKKPFTQPKAK